MSHKFLLFVISCVGLLLVTVVITVVVLTNRKVTTPPSTYPTPQPKVSSAPAIYHISLTTDIKTDKAGTNIEIWLSPKKSPINLSTLSLEVIAQTPTGSLIPKASSPIIAPTFKEGGWTFPFATFDTKVEHQVTLKLAALFVSTQPFPLTQKTLLATIPLKTENVTQPIKVSLNAQNSKAYTNKSELITIE
jgi:hypothetical protein